MTKILVSSIAFNEHVKIKSVIERFLRCPLRDQLDYLVMDDGSNDGTSEVIAAYAQQQVLTLKHENQQGVGAAIRSVINFAIARNYDVLVIMAGNDKDNPDEISRVIDPIVKDGFDFVQGSRYLNGSGAGGDMPLYRRVATRIHPFLMSIITRRSITDSTNGFRAFRLSIMNDQRINLNQEWLHQYELEPYLLFKSIMCGYKFKEVFVTKIYPSKKLGYTKMKPLIGWWSILRPLIYLGLGIRK